MGIQSTGIGSGLDVNTLITKLMQVESQPLTSLAKKEASYQAKLSAYGTLNGALSSFQSSLSSLSSASTFQSFSATSSDTSILSASATSIAVAGSYNLNITKLAQAQSISTAGQVSSTATIGTGTSTVTFQFGTITGGTSTNGVYSGAAFAQDAAQATGTVTIDNSNNSLQGIRDAINIANMGVNASIVGDGSAAPYHLVLTSAKTGATSSLKVNVTGDAAVGNLLNYDPAGIQNLTEATTAQSAALTINGIAITSSTNNVTGAIGGVSINLNKIGTSTLALAANTAAVQTGVNAFVKAYNDLNSTLAGLTAYNSTTKKGGLLLGDPTTQNVQNQVRKTLATAVNGLGGDLTTLSSIGVSFQKDGSLTVDGNKLQTALTSKFGEVGGLFASIGKASDSLVNVVASSKATQAGAYALDISTLATQGGLTGNTADLTLANTTIAPATSLNVILDGTSAAVTLPAGSYSATQLAALVQSSINGTSAFSAIAAAVTASIDANGHLVLQSSRFGSKSNITLADGTGTPAATLAGTNLAGSSGVDVAGSFNGNTALGDGQFLVGGTGTSSEGLKILVSGGATGNRGTINFSVGYASQLNKMVTDFQGTGGALVGSTSNIDRSLKDIAKQKDVLNNRLFDVEARYRKQFTALDLTLSSLTNTSTYLTQQLSALTGTKSY
ncbi:MAG: flagellar filament capping protein FliD [Undibacterium sp.]|uniref:flagellar filament capping protein FliD n=1 Tax=Undibacterium sp. TaxID=1914977 RepID=UPI00271D63B2|nr:flagellar filament capping protein FliD [Undibacterium sp.]MDO8651597.1 flagellar filament capping protein FliD [Undibacterium sp.]